LRAMNLDQRHHPQVLCAHCSASAAVPA
jgi:hypothetical protein